MFVKKVRPKSIKDAARPDYGPIFILFCILGLLVAGYLFSYALNGGGMISFSNKIFPIILCFSLLWAGFETIKRHNLLIWSPLPWFFASSAIYFGFGPLIYYYGSIESIQYVDNFFPVTETDLVRTNLLNGVGIFFVVLGFFIGSKIFPPFKNMWSPSTNIVGIRRLIIIFLVCGAMIKYLWVVPYQFGFIDFSIPGSIIQFQYLTALSIIPLIFLINKGEKRWRVVLCLVIAIEIVVSILEFSKISLLVALMMIFLGLFLCYPKKRVLVITFLTILGAYYLIVPLIPFGRGEISRVSGTYYRGGFGDRMKIVELYLSGGMGKEYESNVNVQGWWVRLNYANAQNFAMNAYDCNNPGKSFVMAIYTPIPRLLWIDKPIISDIGIHFNYLVSLDANTSSSPGLFAEAYWNGGWLLVAVACVFVGIMLAGFTRYSIQKIYSLNFSGLPVIFIGIKMGFRPDGWFVVDYVGALMIAIFTHWLVRLYFYRPKKS